MKSINIFYFDNDLGPFDDFNPRFVMQQKFVKQILSILCKKPGEFYDKETLKRKLKTCDNKNFDHAIDLLSNVSAISFSNGKINLGFPFFMAKDLKKIRKIIDEHLNKNISMIEDGLKDTKQILQTSYPNIDIKISLYHLVCGKIFDGLMFEYLEKKQLLKQSFAQKDERNYMIIGYSKEHLCTKTNKTLLCSFNNARYKTNSLTSFGNATGDRLDYFRYFKLRQINKLHGKFKKIDEDFHDISEQEIVFNSIKAIQDILDKKPLTNSNIYVKHLKTMRYLTNKLRLNVPVFANYSVVLEKIQKSITESIGSILIEDFKQICEQITNSNICCLTHNVEKEQLFNELWHLYFGMLNNFLVKNKTFAKPEKFRGEGSYLKCVYLSDFDA